MPVLRQYYLYYKVLLQYYSVLQSTTPVLLCTTKYYSSTLLCTTKYYASTTLYYKVLRQCYSVLQSTAPVLLCTTKYYSVLHSTTPVLLCTTQYYNVLLCTTKYYASTTLYYTKYYNVLLQYYPVLQCTTLYYSVLLSTTTYYSSTTLYYKVLLQYYSVLQSTTPVLLCTTKYYASTTLYYKVLLRYYSVLQSTTLYYTVLRQYYSVLQSTTPVLLCTTKYYNVLLQYYSVLQSTTPVLLCTRKYYSSTTLYFVLRQYYSVLRQYYNVLLRYYFETSFTMRGATRVTVQLHQILRLPRKMNVINDPHHIWNIISNARSKVRIAGTSPNTAPATQNECQQWWASHMKPHFQCVEPVKSPSNLTKCCACHAKWMSWMICVTYETSFPTRGASKVTLQPHQILRLPRKMNVVHDLRHIWNVISNAWSKKSHRPSSPNTAPATQNECRRWSASHMKRHFQCVEQVKSPSNLTKYCACHAKWMSSMICVTYETSFPMHGASKVTLQPHQILRLPRKMNVVADLRHILRHIWNVISNARSQSSHPPTSPNTAPATKSWISRFQRKHPEVLLPIERRFEDNPSTIRG